MVGENRYLIFMNLSWEQMGNSVINFESINMLIN